MRSMVDLLILLLVFVSTLPTTLAADEAGYVRLRMVEIPDEQGFGQPVVALRFLAPTDWRIEGGVRWNLPLQCQAELVTVHVGALAPAGDLGFEILPSRVWRWSDDPTEVDYWRMGAGPGNQCAIAPPMAAADFRRSPGRSGRRSRWSASSRCPRWPQRSPPRPSSSRR